MADEYRVGRRPDAEIRLADELVSSVHAVLRRTGDGYVIEDSSSKNGTFVNGSRITVQPLHHGDSIRIGVSEFRYSTEAVVSAEQG